MRWFKFAILLGGVLLLSGCVGWPIRAEVSTVEMAARVGPRDEGAETVVARTTLRRCMMLWTPDGLLEEVPWSFSTEYVLSRADGSETALPFLKTQEWWVKILPVPSTNLWIALSRPERRGKREDLDLRVLVFQDDDLIRNRCLKIWWPEYKDFPGYIDFSAARWMIRYPAPEGELQYDIIRDRFLIIPECWGIDEGERFLGVRPAAPQ